MPQRAFTSSVAAGATYTPLTGWTYEQFPAGLQAKMKLLHNATAVGMVCSFISGSDVLMDEDPVPAGGTAGVIPSENTVEPLVDDVSGGDRIILRYRNTTGGAITVNGVVRF